MRKLLTLTFILFALTVHAQSTSTTVSFSGEIPCQFIQLSINRVQNTATQTNLYFSVKECEPGGTLPSKYTVIFNSPIPTQDFNVDRTGAHLLTQTAYGQVKIDWTFTNTTHGKYDATWTYFAPTQSRKTQSDEWQSMHAVGTIGQYQIDKVGSITISSIKQN